MEDGPEKTQQHESEDDLNEIYKNAPDRYTNTTLDKNNDETSNHHRYESKQQTLPQRLPEPLPKNNFEPLQAQDPFEIPTESASTQKLNLIDDELQNDLTKKQIYLFFFYQ